MNFAPQEFPTPQPIPEAVAVSDLAVPPGSAPALAPAALFFDWQIGTAAPASQAVMETAGGSGLMSATVRSGASWLAVTITSAVNLLAISVSVNPAQLGVGTYQGSILVTQLVGPSRVLLVTLTVSNAAPRMISASPANLSFSAPSTTAAPYSQTISIMSSAGATPSTVSQGFWSGGGTGVLLFVAQGIGDKRGDAGDDQCHVGSDLHVRYSL